jgi:hypothetical protein
MRERDENSGGGGGWTIRESGGGVKGKERKWKKKVLYKWRVLYMCACIA